MKTKIPDDYGDIDELLGMINVSRRLDANSWLLAALRSREYVKAFVAQREYTFHEGSVECNWL